MEAEVEVDGKALIIRLPLQKPVPSKSSGKTLVIASTHGTLTSTARVDHGGEDTANTRRQKWTMQSKWYCREPRA